jgi:hypothetical protein
LIGLIIILIDGVGANAAAIPNAVKDMTVNSSCRGPKTEFKPAGIDDEHRTQ